MGHYALGNPDSSMAVDWTMMWHLTFKITI